MRAVRVAVERPVGSSAGEPGGNGGARVESAVAPAVGGIGENRSLHRTRLCPAISRRVGGPASGWLRHRSAGYPNRSRWRPRRAVRATGRAAWRCAATADRRPGRRCGWTRTRSAMAIVMMQTLIGRRRWRTPLSTGELPTVLEAAYGPAMVLPGEPAGTSMVSVRRGQRGGATAVAAGAGRPADGIAGCSTVS